MPTLADLLNGLRQPPQPTMADILAMLTGSGSAQAADRGNTAQPFYGTPGVGPDTVVRSKGAAPVAQPSGPSTARDPQAQKVDQLTNMLIQRGIPPAQARAMALQQIQTR